MLGQARIDQRRLGLVEIDAGVGIDHRRDLAEIAARQGVFAGREDLVRIAALDRMAVRLMLGASLSVCGKIGLEFDHADHAAFDGQDAPREGSLAIGGDFRRRLDVRR